MFSFVIVLEFKHENFLCLLDFVKLKLNELTRFGLDAKYFP